MMGVRASSRLHFGLLNPSGKTEPIRRFGGVGLMIERPSWRVRVAASPSWSAVGTQAERALRFAERFARATGEEERDIELSPRRIVVEQAAPEHAGLGSGTQLALSVARALAASWGLECDLPTLARRAGRGLRSALGVHGFEQGGLLVESGKNSAECLAPLVARLPFPEAWRLVVALPATSEGAAGLHGRDEVEAFARLIAAPGRTETLCRLVLLGLLPALVERDVEAFGEALYEFNVRVGEAFAPVQGGVYASPRVAELVAFARGQGVRGVGQSSWGPAVFAVVADAERGEHLAEQLRERFDLPQSAVWVTAACNHGATLEKEN